MAIKQYLITGATMEIDKTGLVSVGFNPSFIDQVIKDFGQEAQNITKLITDWKNRGAGIAVIEDFFALFDKQVILDVIGLFSNPSQATMMAMNDDCHKVMFATANSHPFLDWLKANVPNLAPIIFQILLKVLVLAPKSTPDTLTPKQTTAKK